VSDGLFYDASFYEFYVLFLYVINICTLSNICKFIGDG